MTPERFAEIELYTKHLTASGQLVGGCLRECLEEIARLRADASTASPSCDRCQSAHCCSVTGSTVPPLCVTDPEGSMPLWMPWTNADVQARVNPLHAEIDRLRAEAGLVVVPELEGIPVVQPEFDDSGNKTHWNVFDSDTDRLLWTEDPEEEWRKHRRIAAHSVPSSRVLKDGEVAVDAGELAALRKLFSAAGNTIANIRSGVTIAEINDAWAGVCSAQIMRTQATATESGEKGGA